MISISLSEKFGRQNLITSIKEINMTGHSSKSNKLRNINTLGKLPVPGRPTISITVGQGPIALAVGAGGGGLDIFTLIYPFSSFSLSLGDGPI